MYINKCTKCGAEFETKNPKRMICPNCLYPERKAQDGASQEGEQSPKQEYPNGYSSGASFGGDDENRPQQRSYDRPRYDRNNGGYNNRYDRNSNYNSYGDRPQRNYENRGSYGDRPQRNYGDRPRYDRNNGYQRNNYNRSNNYGDRPQRNYENRGSYGDRPQRSYGDRPQRNFNNRGGGFNRRGGGFNKRPQQKNKQLLISREQLEQIEIMYKKALPLPNHDVYEVIGQALGIEPRKVFFGINLVRQKLMLPKLPFPKRKLAVTPDQLNAIKMLYEPLLPVPPIGCHKIIAAQLKMDEWRVHVGIGLIRKQMGLDRWNPDRPDAPKEFKK